MPNDFYGLPLHPLIVHATVVMIPLAAMTVLLAVLWPGFATWAGPMPAILSLIGLVLVPLSTSTGETLERHVAHSALLDKHTRLADGLLPWMIALLVVSLISYVIHRKGASGRMMRRSIRAAVAVLAVAAVAGTTVQVALIGHSGAKAAWQNTNMSSSARR
ncbi:hypothetical protein GCM10022234_22930 [Aeromicrobium panaciterrae]|uniref:DUF2231 domain-containing protein n=1 Tax=Aeromicrobium panaciterrae TaxID=363861 RepID=UPI0031E2B242